MSSPHPVHDQTVLITGASRGIGAAAARHLAGLGAKVVLAARTASDIGQVAQAIADDGGTASAVACDVTRSADVAAAVAHCVDHFGGLDVLVNNAGVIDPVHHIADFDPDTWGRVIDINVKGVFHGLHHGIPAMLARGGGTVINLSSGAATKALEGWSHYCASKAAVLSLTRVAHVEYAERGIRVVGLSPGTVETHMQDVIRDSGINPVSQLDPSVHLSPDDVAQAIAYLCTPDAAEVAGDDFSIKTPEGRARVGLPPPKR